MQFIELKKDFSNIDAVIARLEDLEDLGTSRRPAFDRLVGSGDFSYRQLVKLVDTTISRKAASCARRCGRLCGMFRHR